MSITVALDLQSTVGKKTGIGNYAFQLFSALNRLNDGNRYLPLDWGRDPVMQIHRRLQWQQSRLPQRARAAHADLLHVTGFDAPLWQPCRVVVTLHDLIGKLFPENMPPVGRWYWSRWLPFSLRFAPHLIVPSEATAHDATRLLGIPRARMTLVPYGVHASFHPVAEPTVLADVRARLKLPQRFVLYLGTIEPRKGLDTLLDAFAQLGQYLPDSDDVGLVIAGKKGWFTDTLFAHVQHLGLGMRVNFLGYIDDQDRAPLYSLASVCVLPSRYEGTGLPLLESMACGTPVIYAHNSGMPEAVGDAGLSFQTDQRSELAARLAQVLSQPELAAHLRAAGLARVKQFSWERAARETAVVYTRVLAA